MQYIDANKIFDRLIERYKSSNNINKYNRNFVVFDWDNTCAMYDVQHNVFRYQVMNLLFKKEYFEIALAKDFIFDDFSLSIKTRIVELFYQLIDLKNFKNNSLYDEFIAMMLYFYSVLSKKLSYEIACFRILYLFSGMSEKEVRKISNDAIKYCHDIKLNKQLYTFTFNNIQYRFTFNAGLRGIYQIKKLFNNFAENNIDVYICSASMKITVEEFAGGFGFNLDRKQIYGLYLKQENNLFIPEKDDTKISTFLKGKADTLRLLQLKYNKPPLIYMGDSSGDYDALTYSGLLYSVIANIGNSGKINELVELSKNNPRFIVLYRDDINAEYV